MESELDLELNIQPKPLTNWVNAPEVADLKQDYTSALTAHSIHKDRVDGYIYNLLGKTNFKKSRKRSSVQPKLIRKQAEWRYAALSEPFLSNDKLFKVTPVTYEDSFAAKQNELLLNHQFTVDINRVNLIDTYIRTAVDTGTAILRTGWEEFSYDFEYNKPSYTIEEIDQEDIFNVAKFNRVAKQSKDPHIVQTIPIEWLNAVKVSENETTRRKEELQQQLVSQAQEQLAIAQQNGMGPEELQQRQEAIMQDIQQQVDAVPPAMYMPKSTGSSMKKKTRVINRPTVEVCDYRDIIVDPSCLGNFDKAEFVIYVFDTCKADLIADGRYQNLDAIQNNIQRTDRYDIHGDNFRDPARKKLTAYEYWGNWDIHGDGTKVPIVATWIGDVMIRLEENPFPDKKPPFVFVSYLPVPNDLYGEPDGALLVENQEIIGALTRGMIDLLGRSANSQVGIAKGTLDTVNKDRFDKGLDYEFNPTMPPANAIFQHTYPEIPQSALTLLQLMENDAEALTGVKAYAGGISGDQLGKTATGVRGVLDAASKREMGILRRLADGLIQIAKKIIAMNSQFLNEQEVIRVTNQDFVEVRRDDLVGNFDLALDVSTAEQDNAKSEELSFILQTLGNNVDPSFSQIVLSEICRLKHMPELAERIANFEPKPDPLAEKLKELQVQLAEAEIQKVQAEIQKLGADTQLNSAKAQTEAVNAQVRPMEVQMEMDMNEAKNTLNRALAEKHNLDYLQEIQGIKHKQNMEIQAAQAKAQADKSAQELALRYAFGDFDKTSKKESK